MIKFYLSILAITLGVHASAASLATQQDNDLENGKVVYLNFGNFNQWIIRNIKESGIIGGNTKTIYAVGPNTTINGRVPYHGMGGSPWATSNVLAHVSGIYKTNQSVYRESRPGNGYCAKLMTHLEQVKVLGIINIKVLAAGSLYLGQMMEPITSSSDPMKYLNCGIKFNGKPKAIMFDYAAKIVPGNRIKQTGFGGAKKIDGQDYANCILLLQKRWEDGNGNIYAKRIGTMIYRIGNSTEWKNNQQFDIHYGNITQTPYYRSYMGLTSLYYAKNSKGEMVPIKEVGWGEPNDTPTHLFVKFDSSHGGAYIGTVGNTLWIDNVRLVY